jgi:hypothetical protein
MSYWTKVSIKIVELLGQHLQTPEYLKCCGVESNDAPIRSRTNPNQPPVQPTTTTSTRNIRQSASASALSEYSKPSAGNL